MIVWASLIASVCIALVVLALVTPTDRIPYDTDLWTGGDPDA